MKKEVELFIGVPCSGKSTYLRNNYNPEDVFVLSRDDVRNELIKGTDYVYSDFFKMPKEGDKPNEKYGEILSTGEWSKVAHLNSIVKNNFDKRIQKANDVLEKNKKVIVDLVNMTRMERDMVKNWFNNVEDVTFSAVIFDYENNLDTIKTQIDKRGRMENKIIPFFVVESMIEKSDPVEMDEFKNIKCVDGLAQLKKENTLKENKKQRRKSKLTR